MESHDNSGKGLLIAHAICCGGLLLAILIASNTAFLLSLVRSGAFWAGTALLVGGVALFLIRRRWTCRPRPPTADSRPPLHSSEVNFHD